MNKVVYGNSLIQLFDLIIDKIEGGGEYSLRDLQKIIREKYKEVIKVEHDKFINEKIEEYKNKEEYKNYNISKLKKIIKKDLYI